MIALPYPAVEDRLNTEMSKFYLKLLHSIENPPIKTRPGVSGALKAKRLDEGGTQTFDMHKYSIITRL